MVVIMSVRAALSVSPVSRAIKDPKMQNKFLGSTAVGAALALGRWVVKVATQKPVTVSEGKPFLHGTRNWHKPPEEGEEFEVNSHFFVIPAHHEEADAIAKSYASGEGVSALSHSSVDLKKTGVILKVAPVQDAALKRGFFGGHPYFVHGTKLKVLEVRKLSEEELAVGAAKREEIDSRANRASSFT
jgi:hypothetical protein